MSFTPADLQKRSFRCSEDISNRLPEETAESVLHFTFYLHVVWRKVWWCLMSIPSKSAVSRTSTNFYMLPQRADGWLRFTILQQKKPHLIVDEWCKVISAAFFLLTFFLMTLCASESPLLNLTHRYICQYLCVRRHISLILELLQI